MVVPLWATWYARRRLIHDGKQQIPLSTFLFVRSFIQDLGMVPHAAAGHRRIPMSGIHPKWLAPSVECVKINVDAATSKADDGGAVAAVCRREDGAFLGASAQGSSSPAMLEALACREALAPRKT
jgi:hypothetical protein